MTRYVVRRVLILLPVWLTVYTLTFTLYHLTPGGPWDREKPVPPQAIAQLNQKYGLDRPLWQQYLDYLGGVVTRFDFGPSYSRVARGVGDIIRELFPVSLRIGALAMSLAVLLGIPLGVMAAVRYQSVADRAALVISVLGVSLPSFVVGPILIWVFALQLAWLPPGGIDGWQHHILPAITLSLFPMSLLARATRASLIEVLSADYVRTARSKGLREGLVVRRHALRNALIPVITIGGILLAEVLVGSFYVETVFAVPGIGRQFVTSVTSRDYPLLMGVTLLMTTVVALVNLAVDLSYALLDPRIRYG
ncbi:MAG: ABC transporter permease [Chloroflexi bacterium]|nr:ABC transporter permease [Chloroflexota bacterium]